MAQYLNMDGVNALWAKIKNTFALKSHSHDNPGGYIYIEDFDKNNFQNALNLALSSLQPGQEAIIDCTYFSGVYRVTSGFIINNPITLLFGGITIEFDNPVGSNLFTFNSNNISIIGINRNTDKSQTDNGATLFKMLNPDSSLNGYHIKSRGNKNLSIKDITLEGLRTTMGRQYNNSSYPIDGVGGIYIEKAKPEITEGGNTCNNIRIDNILIAGTKSHGIYIDTPILSSIKNVRLSDCGGHGLFINNGTSIMLENVYSSSANMAGFCIYGSSYVSLNNCVTESSGIGFWIRSAFNVTLMNPGVELTKTFGNNPWKNSQPITNKYGLGLTTTASNGVDIVNISDVNTEFRDCFIGYGILITGGKAINIFSPYIKSIAQTVKSEAYPSGTSISQNVKYINVVDNARSIYILNPGFKEVSGSAVASTIKHEIGIAAEVSGIELIYNTNLTILEGNLDNPNYVTNSDLRAPIYCKSTDAVIRNGKELITNLTSPTPNTNQELANKQYVDSMITTHTHTSFANNITVTGKVSASNGFYQDSDERLKTFYDPIKVDLEKLKTLRKNYFKFNDKDKLEIGVSAQEIQEIYPELVSTNDEGYLSVAYDKLSVVALTALDEQQKEIDDLKNQLSTIKDTLKEKGIL